MRNVVELQASYEKGIYTFGEVVTALVCEGASRSTEDLAREMSEEFLEGVKESSCSLPMSATAEDVVVFKSSRAHAEEWFKGAVNWRRHFTAQGAAH
jgi:2-keto-4-pentenoate hydratase/2-oxohepta-3-ene-1,7-dioic acid hydratase in catechol pathway